MTDIALKSHTALKSSRPQWLRATFDWLRQANVAARLPLESVDDLSDRELRDIGGERRDIAKAMDRELREIGLLGTGWQQPRRRTFDVGGCRDSGQAESKTVGSENRSGAYRST